MKCFVRIGATVRCRCPGSKIDGRIGVVRDYCKGGNKDGSGPSVKIAGIGWITLDVVRLERIMPEDQREVD